MNKTCRAPNGGCQLKLSAPLKITLSLSCNILNLFFCSVRSKILFLILCFFFLDLMFFLIVSVYV